MTVSAHAHVPGVQMGEAVRSALNPVEQPKTR